MSNRPGRLDYSRPVLVLQPNSLADALAERARRPAATVVAGGTGLLPELNGGMRPEALLDLSRVRDLAAAHEDRGVVRLGATVTYTRVVEELADRLPGVAQACRTVASRQIRNRGTLGGALALRDPASDALAALMAAGATAELAGPAGVRTVPVQEVAVAPGELLTAIAVPLADGPVAYAKMGLRNAMARAVCGVAVALSPVRRTVAIGIVGSTAARAPEAEALLAREAPWDGGPPGEQLLRRAGRLAADAVPAIPPHLVAVLTRRALERAWS